MNGARIMMITVLIILIIVAISTFALAGIMLYELWKESDLREDIIERRKKKRGEP